MNPATGAVLTGSIVLLGQWAKDEPVSIRVVVGGSVLALGLSVLSESAPKLASQFALLVTLVAAFTYLPAIFSKVGLISGPAPDWNKS